MINRLKEELNRGILCAPREKTTTENKSSSAHKTTGVYSLAEDSW